MLHQQGRRDQNAFPIVDQKQGLFKAGSLILEYRTISPEAHFAPILLPLGCKPTLFFLSEFVTGGIHLLKAFKLSVFSLMSVRQKSLLNVDLCCFYVPDFYVCFYYNSVAAVILLYCFPLATHLEQVSAAVVHQFSKQINKN